MVICFRRHSVLCDSPCFTKKMSEVSHFLVIAKGKGAQLIIRLQFNINALTSLKKGLLCKCVMLLIFLVSSHTQRICKKKKTLASLFLLLLSSHFLLIRGIPASRTSLVGSEEIF
jgi:tetrahydromethanopterin S-methyltransferase subunit E